MRHGRTWKQGRASYRYVYAEHKGRKYKRKQKLTKKGWIFVGIVLVLLAAGMWAPAGGYSWLFKMKYL